MGHRVFYYSASHPEGRVFDSDETIGPEWVDHPHKVAQKSHSPAVVDLMASDEELAGHGKDALEAAAREHLGVELDRRKSVPNMIRDIRAAQE